VTRLAECLLGIADQPSLEKALGVFEPVIRREFTDAMVKRLGVQSRGPVLDNELVRALWIFLAETKAPFEQTFFDWFGGLASSERAARSSSKISMQWSRSQPFGTHCGISRRVMALILPIPSLLAAKHVRC
jgi:uncharacterized protein YdiU (UPF0061 family)